MSSDIFLVMVLIARLSIKSGRKKLRKIVKLQKQLFNVHHPYKQFRLTGFVDPIITQETGILCSLFNHFSLMKFYEI